jgi:hypothetical protein
MLWNPQPDPPSRRRSDTPRPSRAQRGGIGPTPQSRLTLDIVISRGPPTPHMDPALEWAQELPQILTGSRATLKVYAKPAGNPTGGICSAFLKHIVDNYDNLPDFTFFLKDEEWSWTHTGSIKQRFIEAIQSRRRYFNINDAAVLPQIYDSPHVRLIEEWYTDHIDKWIPFNRLSDPDWATGYRGGNQFLVHKSLIEELPKEFYINMYRWVMTSGLPPETTDEMLGTTWHLFFVLWPRIRARQRRMDKIAASGGMAVPSTLPPIV